MIMKVFKIKDVEVSFKYPSKSDLFVSLVPTIAFDYDITYTSKHTLVAMFVCFAVIVEW